MSLRAALFAGLGALVLILALGNPATSDTVGDDEDTFTTWNLIVFGATWDTGLADEGEGLGAGDEADDLRTGMVLRAFAFVGLCALLGGLVGRARHLAAFLGGWAITFFASAIGTTILFEVGSDGTSGAFGGGDSVLDTLTTGGTFWAPLALCFGWVVGLATAFGATLPLAPHRGLATAADVPQGPPPPYSPGAYATGASGTAYATPPPPTLGHVPPAGSPPGAPAGPAISTPPERTTRHEAVPPPAGDQDAPPSPS